MGLRERLQKNIDFKKARNRLWKEKLFIYWWQYAFYLLLPAENRKLDVLTLEYQGLHVLSFEDAIRELKNIYNEKQSK